MLVSVIMANYNKGHFINEAIGSVLSQTLTDFELIVVDDASTDDSLSIVRKAAKADNRIKILTNETNSGVSFALNKGMKAVSGKYVCFIDSDDLFRPERIEKMVDALKGRLDYIAYTDIFRIDKDSKVINASYLGSKRLPPDGDAYAYLLREWIWGLSTMMFPASVISEVG